VQFFLLKKIKIQDVMGKTTKFIGYLAHQSLGSFAHMAKSWSSSKITRKINLIQEI
jgi:hypothetical protein